MWDAPRIGVGRGKLEREIERLLGIVRPAREHLFARRNIAARIPEPRRGLGDG
jgi:hypothetical protein